MQDEELDNMDELIREASKNHHPVYDDNAWKKMEALLDKHLPLKENRRRPIIIFLLMLLFAGAVFFAILYQSRRHSIEYISGGRALPGIPIKRTAAGNQPGNKHVIAKESTPKQNTSKKNLRDNNKKYIPGNLNTTSVPDDPAIKRANAKNNDSAISDPADEKDKVPESEKALPLKDQQVANYDKNSMTADSPGVSHQHVDTGIQNHGNDSTRFIATNQTTKAVMTEPRPGKSPSKRPVKKGFANNFAISLSAGPDLSFTSSGNAGKASLSYGAGLSYTFLKNRVTLKSGFYVANKIYSAGGGDYHPPGWYWTYNTNLVSVNADCKMYEIPLAASYNFKQSKNHSWFAGMGFSTFLMKRETYHYSYKDDPWGQTLHKTWTLRNGKEQYFSVLTISGGYQYHVSHNLSILAEPYLKLPLNGIGFGKIKLNSGGLLFTASLKPFAKGK